MFRSDVVFFALAVTLFGVGGIVTRPPALEALSQENARVADMIESAGDITAMLTTDSGLDLYCTKRKKARSRHKLKCPTDQLQQSVRSMQSLILWHDRETIYQIQQGDVLLLSHDRWLSDSNFMLSVAGFWLLLAVPVIRNTSKERERLREEANVQFRSMRISSENPRFSFNGITAAAVHDVEDWMGSKLGISYLCLTRYAMNEHGEYFVFISNPNGPLVKHIDLHVARAVLNTKFVELLAK